MAQVRNTIAAFKLAAEGDSFRAPQIAWPSLMQALENLMPDEGDVERLADSLFAEDAASADRPI
jgi:hypothetical protein